jgi:hypothetical protein
MNDWYEQAVTGGIEVGWINPEGTKLRLRALHTIHEQMDKDSQRSMPPMIIFAPSFGTGGQTMRRDMPTNSVFVYLAPSLEYEWQANVDFIVAHELAHVVLGHGKLRQQKPEEVGLPHELTTDEIAASDLVAKWKIPKVNPEESRFLKLLPTDLRHTGAMPQDD